MIDTEVIIKGLMLCFVISTFALFFIAITVMLYQAWESGDKSILDAVTIAIGATSLYSFFVMIFIGAMDVIIGEM